MRRLVMFNRVTADGYFASEDGKLDWVIPDPEVDKLGATGTGEFDTVVLGRKTYEMFASFWPHIDEHSDTAPNPHDPRKVSKEMKEMGKMLNAATKLVFSSTLRNPTWQNTRILSRLDPVGFAAIKKGPGKDMIMFGSGTITSQLTEHGLIDEYQYIVSPIILGKGKKLIDNVSKSVKLELVDQKSFPTGTQLLKYVPATDR